MRGGDERSEGKNQRAKGGKEKGKKSKMAASKAMKRGRGEGIQGTTATTLGQSVDSYEQNAIGKK